MKITSIDIFRVKWNRQYGAWHPIMVRINTDAGISGFGEAGIFYGSGFEATIGSLKDLGKRLIGQDPTRIEAIWQQFYQGTFWGKSGGATFYAAVSALDIALWDIKGKSLNVPVYELLGGATRTRIRSYASQLQFGWEGETRYLIQPEEYADAAKRAISQAYTAVKVDPFMVDRQGHLGRRLLGMMSQADLQLNYDRIKAIRDAVGPDVDIILECHAGLDVNTAVQFVQKVAPLNIYYMEEAFSPMNPGLAAKIKEKTAIPQASGERIVTRFGFQPYLVARSLDVIQPDVAICGGISEAKKICDMAATYEVACQLHVCGTPIATAAALQVEAVLPNALIHEHHEIALKAGNQWIGKYPDEVDNGDFVIPDRPGIGQELSQAAIEKSVCETIE